MKRCEDLYQALERLTLYHEQAMEFAPKFQIDAWDIEREKARSVLERAKPVADVAAEVSVDA